MSPKDFSQFVNSRKEKFFRYALSYLQTPAKAEDAVQDILMKLWERCQASGAPENMEAWCIRCLRNRALDILKSKANRNGSLDAVVGVQSADNVSKRLEQRDIISRLSELMDQLPDKQKEIFRLREFMMYSNQEIQKIMGLNATDVKVNLYRARMKMREALQSTINYGVHDG